jgi:hypothetical protein
VFVVRSAKVRNAGRAEQIETIQGRFVGDLADFAVY